MNTIDITYDIVTKKTSTPLINTKFIKWRNYKIKTLISPKLVAPFPYLKRVHQPFENETSYFSGWYCYNVFNNKHQPNVFISNNMIISTLKWLSFYLWESNIPFVHGELTLNNLIVNDSKLWILFNTYGNFRPLLKFKEHTELYKCIYILKDLYLFGNSIIVNNLNVDSSYKFKFYNMNIVNELYNFTLNKFNYDGYLELDDHGNNIPPIVYDINDIDTYFNIVCSVNRILESIRLL